LISCWQFLVMCCSGNKGSFLKLFMLHVSCDFHSTLIFCVGSLKDLIFVLPILPFLWGINADFKCYVHEIEICREYSCLMCIIKGKVAWASRRMLRKTGAVPQPEDQNW
jgi:hypothetical protein